MGDRSTDQAIRDIVSGAGVVYTGLILEMAIAFLAQVLAARYLSLGDFGGLTAGTALLNLGAIVATFGLDEGLTRYLPRADDDERTAMVRGVFALAVPASIVLGVICAIGAPFLAIQVFDDPSIIISLRVFGLAIPFATVLILAVGGIRGQEFSHYRVYVQNLLQPLSRFAFVLVAVAYGLGQLGFALAYALPYALGAGGAIILLNRALPGPGGTRFSRKRLTELVSYSLPMSVSKGAGFVYRSADIFLVLYFLRADAVGAYGVAYAAARLVLLFSTAFNFLGAPIASRLESTEGVDGMVAAHRQVIRWLVVISAAALLPFVLFPTGIITHVYRPRYASGASALTVLAVGFAVHNILGPQGNLLRGLGASRELAANGVIAAVVNVVLNVLLIPVYGIVGAAAATTTSYLLLDVLMTVELHREIGKILVSRDVVVAASLAIPVFAAGWWTRGTVPSTLPWIAVFCAVASLAYFVLVISITGLTAVDVMLVKSVDERFELPTAVLVRIAEWLER